MGKGRKIRKEQKIQFAISFMEQGGGFKALENAGLPQDYDLLFKLLNDDFVNDYIEKYVDLVEIAKGNAKEAHIAALEKVFKQTTGEEESTIFKFTRDGDFVQRTGKFVRPADASRLSERIEKMKGWDKTAGKNFIDVDLQLGINEVSTLEEEETAEERDEKVFNHFKSEALL